MANATVDVLRAVHDESYAAELTQEQFDLLVQDPVFQEIAADTRSSRRLSTRNSA